MNFARMGTVPDRVIGEALGISRYAARRRRIALGIPAYSRKLRLVLLRLGREPDTVIARSSGLGVATVSRLRRARKIPPLRPVVRLTDEIIEKLGTRPDSMIARHHKVSRTTVHRWRRERSIGRYRPDITPYLGRLGREADLGIADELGVSAEFVRGERIRRKIPPYRRPYARKA